MNALGLNLLFGAPTGNQILIQHFLEDEAARSTLQAEKNKVKALEKEAVENDKEWMDLRVRFTRKVKQVRKAEWDVQDANIAIAQLKEERDLALDELKTHNKKTITWMEAVMASARKTTTELKGSHLYRTAQDDILQSMQEKLEQTLKELHNVRYAQVSTSIAILHSRFINSVPTRDTSISIEHAEIRIDIDKFLEIQIRRIARNLSTSVSC